MNAPQTPSPKNNNDMPLHLKNLIKDYICENKASELYNKRLKDNTDNIILSLID